MSKYVQLVSITASGIPFRAIFSDANQTQLPDQKIRILSVHEDFRRKKKVNQKSLPIIRSFGKKPSTNCLSNQHTAKTITVLKPATLATSIKFTTNHQ
jgi:hypothetical protein